MSTEPNPEGCTCIPEYFSTDCPLHVRRVDDDLLLKVVEAAKRWRKGIEHCSCWSKQDCPACKLRIAVDALEDV